MYSERTRCRNIIEIFLCAQRRWTWTSSEELIHFDHFLVKDDISGQIRSQLFWQNIPIYDNRDNYYTFLHSIVVEQLKLMCTTLLHPLWSILMILLATWQPPQPMHIQMGNIRDISQCIWRWACEYAIVQELDWDHYTVYHICSGIPFLNITLKYI